MVELVFDIKKQSIQVFNDVYNEKKAREMAENAKKKVFGIISGIVRFIDKRDDIFLTHLEKRYEPFWHIIGEILIEYKRDSQYGFAVEPQVRAVKISSKIFNVSAEKPYCVVDGEDHCVEHYEKEIVVDATIGKNLNDKKLKKYLTFKSRQIKQTEELMGRNKIVIPAKIRASFLARDLIKGLIRPVHADKILNEKVAVKKLCLYFRPIYAFEFMEKSTGKKKALEINALTGEIKKGSVFKTQIKELMPEHALFELGAEIAAEFVPGAGAAAVIGRELSERRKRKKAIESMKVSQKAFAKKRKKKK